MTAHTEARGSNRRALVTGWFTFFHGEATAGDLLAGETVRNWLTEAGIPHDTALSPVLGGPSLDDIDPSLYTHLVFVCGPAGGWQVDDLLGRFAHCMKLAVGVSVVASTPPGFDVLLSRDGPMGDRPDLSLAADIPMLPPRVAVVRAHPQNEYPDARQDEVHQLVDDVLRSRDVAVLELDTRVDPRSVVGRRAVDVEAALAGVDAVVTTRMHGLVLALRLGTPAVAIDPVHGGAKVSRQAAVLGWPAVQTVDRLTADWVTAQLSWSLTPEAARTARNCALHGRRGLGEVHYQFLTHFTAAEGRSKGGTRQPTSA